MNEFISQIDIKKIINWQRLLEVNPDENGLYLYLVIIFAILILVAIIARFISHYRTPKYHRKLINKISVLLITSGIIGLVIIFFRFQGVPYLGSRIMLLILLIVFIIWLGFIVYYWLVVLPKEIIQDKERQRFEKYLPRRQVGLPKTMKGNK